ncbi:hypothetical protein Poli38472_000197 [Pythium oligandrum]|uniref:FYVE-type domain-containing protein n=1 Tax=Pythium oligandrum TaxID=41045 RepID=A0A8K1CC92_PYTOL|nr:hypothetical protein Poli38472_000197 [Pythium oligandrum]|eukprot:TMW60155.1 hypothetical protein Poli38472_000197 [Pythium oligandrum]
MGLDKFPVDESCLPRLHVPAQRLELWKEVAHDEIMRALANPNSWLNAFKDRIKDGYELVADRPQLKAFIRDVPNSPDKDLLIRSTLEGCTLDDLAFGLYAETTYDLRCAFAHLYEESFLDAGVIQVHERRTDIDPMQFTGIKWLAIRSPAQAIMTSRDFLYFAYEGTAHDVDGNRVIFRFLRTMPMDDIAVDDSQHPPLIRGKISNLNVYRQNGSHVDCYIKAMHSNAGSMPSWLVHKTVQLMFPGIANVQTVCDARALLQFNMTKHNPSRISASPYASSVSSDSGIPNPTLAAPNACGVCFHKFKITRSKRRCQSCARLVCKRCTESFWMFDERKQLSDVGVATMRFCLNCLRQARANLRDPVQVNLRTESSASVSRPPQQNVVRRRLSREANQYMAGQPEPEPSAYPYNRSRGTSSAHSESDYDDEVRSYSSKSSKNSMDPRFHRHQQKYMYHSPQETETMSSTSSYNGDSSHGRYMKHSMSSTSSTSSQGKYSNSQQGYSQNQINYNKLISLNEVSTTTPTAASMHSQNALVRRDRDVASSDFIPLTPNSNSVHSSGYGHPHEAPQQRYHAHEAPQQRYQGLEVQQRYPSQEPPQQRYQAPPPPPQQQRSHGAPQSAGGAKRTFMHIPSDEPHRGREPAPQAPYDDGYHYQAQNQHAYPGQQMHGGRAPAVNRSNSSEDVTSTARDLEAIFHLQMQLFDQPDPQQQKQLEQRQLQMQYMQQQQQQMQMQMQPRRMQLPPSTTPQAAPSSSDPRSRYYR